MTVFIAETLCLGAARARLNLDPLRECVNKATVAMFGCMTPVRGDDQ